MKAVILCSGPASRLKPLTQKIPKTLIDVNGNTILYRILKSLKEEGITKVLITTGPFENMIKNHVRENFPDIEVEYVNNPNFETTNYIYTLWLAKDLIDDDVLLIHGDLVFDHALLKMLLKRPGSAVLVNNKIKPPQKDFKGVIKDGKIIKVGVEFFGQNTFFLVPMYKLSRRDFGIWMKEIERFVKAGNTKCYAEVAFNKISKRITIKPVYFGKEFCMEIDDCEDLERAMRKKI